MNLIADPEIVSFATQVLEQRGGLVEKRPDGVFALLPESLCRSMDLPEEVQLGSEEYPLMYGAPVLDRLINLATERIQIVYGRLNVPYVKKEGFEQLLARDLSFPNATLRITGKAEAQTTYLMLACHYIALSDERKEGLVQVALCEKSNALVPELLEEWKRFEVEYFPAGQAPPHFPMYSQKTVDAALKGAKGLVEKDLAGFVDSMCRHLRRDLRNTREYYETLEREMTGELKYSHLTPAQREERKAKIQGLSGEMKRKMDDLRHKYRVQVNLRASAARRLLMPVATVFVEVKYRGTREQISLVYNPVSHRLDPVACHGCGQSTRSVWVSEAQTGIHLLCSRCHEK